MESAGQSRVLLSNVSNREIFRHTLGGEAVRIVRGVALIPTQVCDGQILWFNGRFSGIVVSLGAKGGCLVGKGETYDWYTIVKIIIDLRLSSRRTGVAAAGLVYSGSLLVVN